VPSYHPPPDESLERRALPFAVTPAIDDGPVRRPSVLPKISDFNPVTHTQPLIQAPSRVAPEPLARVAPASIPAPPRTPPPAPPPPMAPAMAAPVTAPPPPAPRPPEESVVVVPSDGTPPFVLRFLLVCGVLTMLGLMALIYLEL